MRDVIDGMEELANMSGFSPKAGDCLEILGIESPETFFDKDIPERKPAATSQTDNVVIPLKRKKQAAA